MVERKLAVLVFIFSLAIGCCAQDGSLLPSNLKQQIDSAAREVLTTTGVPSASIAVVRDGKVAYVHAYGNAHLDPTQPATPEMRYSIGSISKQFTAAAILLLQQQGKLSIDDPVGKYVEGLMRGNEVTIRQILSHTSGYQDYYPQDYTPPLMTKPITAQQILDRWARKPLDFEPGTKWEYSNTNFVIAGLIVEKVSGESLFTFLQKNVFGPLDMQSVMNSDEHKLTSSDPGGYFRYALGPAHPVVGEGNGWMFAAGELAMTPADLAKWDISLMNETLLKPESYRQLETEVVLKDGLGTGYGLGIEVHDKGNHRELEHSGEVAGFTAENIVFPDDHIAVVVLTNQEAARAAGQIGNAVGALLLKASNPANAEEDTLVRKVYEQLAEGKIDRSQFTDNANFYFTQQGLDDYKDSLKPLGKPDAIVRTAHESRGGMMFLLYDVVYPQRTLQISIYRMPDGKFEQFIVRPKN